MGIFWSNRGNNPSDDKGNDDRKKHDTISVLLIGPVGTGKSSTGNRILQTGTIFKVYHNDVSTTRECQPGCSQYQGKVITVVDMPGLGDPTKKQVEEVGQFIQEAKKALAQTPDGYDAILVTLQFGRQTADNETIIKDLKDIYGKSAFKQYGILVITHGDHFKRMEGKTETVEDYCSRQHGLLNFLWKECNKRVVLFDNITENPEELEAQRRQLVNTVGDMKSNDRYTREVFEAALATRTWMIRRRWLIGACKKIIAASTTSSVFVITSVVVFLKDFETTKQFINIIAMFPSDGFGILCPTYDAV